MDEIDRRIIGELQRDGRISNQELSERVGLSASPCLRRVRALESSGVIRGYTAIINEDACGLAITAFVRVRISPVTREIVSHFERSIRDVDVVMECHVTSGEADYLLKVLARTPGHYEEFVRNYLHKIEGVSSIDTTFAYGVTKRTASFPVVRSDASAAAGKPSRS